MKDPQVSPYPGANANPIEIVALADEYRAAAVVLMQRGRPREPLSRAPARLCAIHAIELYLNAFLLKSGLRPDEVRAHCHNLADRTEVAVANGLILRRLTQQHLVKLTSDREYLVSRYGPEMSATLSQINRLMATLEEVARKVRLRVGTAGLRATEIAPTRNELAAPRTTAAARSP